LDPNLRVVDAPPDHGGPEQFDAHVIEGTQARLRTTRAAQPPGSCAALVTRSLA
jgi:hypothetical protein